MGKDGCGAELKYKNNLYAVCGQHLISEDETVFCKKCGGKYKREYPPYDEMVKQIERNYKLAAIFLGISFVLIIIRITV